MEVESFDAYQQLRYWCIMAKNTMSKVRKVAVSDKDDVMEISRHIWDGHDYLPLVIDEWVRDPSSNVYGVQENSRLVAVANLRIIEGGRTGWMEGLRVHPNHRGKGYAEVLTDKLIAIAKKKGAQRLRYTTSSENEASLKLAEKHGFNRVLEMAGFWHSSPKTKLPVAADLEVRKADHKEVYKLLQSNRHVVPAEVLVYDWKALDVSPENLKKIGESHEFQITTKKDKITSLSLGYPRRRPDHSMWTFTIYADSPEGFVSQLSFNTASLAKHNCSTIRCTYAVKFEEIVHNIEWISKDEHWTHLVLLERKVWQFEKDNLVFFEKRK